MATEIINSAQFVDYDASKKLNMDKIFFKKGDALFSLKDLYIFESSLKVRKVRSFADYEKNKRKVSVSNTLALATTEGPLQMNYEVPPIHTEVDADLSSKSAGYLKYLKTKSEPLSFNKSKHLLVHINNSKEPTFVKIEDLYYYDGLTKKFVESLEDLNTKELYSNGKLVSKAYLANVFSFDNAKFKIKDIFGGEREIDAVSVIFDKDTMKKTTYSIVYENGAPKLNKDGTFAYTSKTEDVNQSYVTRNHTTKDMPVDNSEKTEEVSMVAIKEYKCDENGEYVLIQLENKSKQTLVNIENLKTLTGEAIADIDVCIGQSLKVVIDGVEYTTKPLTLEQVSVKFNALKHYNQTLLEEDILTENSKLKLKTGEYVSEKEVARPMYYKTLDSSATDFDAYVISTVNASGEDCQMILNKAYLESAAAGKSSTFNLDGYAIDISKIVKVKRVANFSECDVIQTSSSVDDKNNFKNIETCKIYANQAERNADKDNVETEFVNNYKNNSYVLKTVFVNDELVELDERNKRYVHSEEVLKTNRSDKLPVYKALKKDAFYYESVDGELGKIKGGPSYDIGKGITEGYKTWGKAVGGGLVFTLSPVGILITLAMPVVMAGAIAAAVVAPVAIPVTNLVYGTIKNTFNRFKYPNPDKVNDKEWCKALYSELENFKKSARDADKFKEIQFYSACDKIDSMVASLKDAHTLDGFELVDGKVEITSHNVNAVTKFMSNAKIENAILKNNLSLAKHNSLASLVKKLSKKSDLSEEEQDDLDNAKSLLEKEELCKRYFKLLKKKESKLTDEEKAELDELKIKYEEFTDAFKSKMTSYKSEPVESKPSEYATRLMNNAQTLKAFTFLKMFTSEDTFVVDGADVTIDRDFLKDLEYDFATNKFMYKHKPYAYDTGLGTDVESIAHSEGLLKTKDENVEVLSNIKKVLESAEFKAKISKDPVESDIIYTKKDDDEKVKELAELAEKIEALKTECAEIYECILTKLGEITFDAYKFIATTRGIAESINNDVITLATFDEFAVTVDNLKDIIEAIENKKDSLNETLNDASKGKDNIELIEASVVEFDKIEKELKAKSLSVGNKDEILAEFEAYNVNVTNAYEAAKNSVFNSDLELNLETINANKISAQELLNKLNLQLVNEDKRLLLDKAQQFYILAENDLNSLNSTSVKKDLIEFNKILRANKTILKNMVNQIASTETSAKDAALLKNKVERIYKINNVGVKSLMVVEAVKQRKAAANVQSTVGAIVGRIEALMKVDESMSVKELENNYVAASSIYERELAPYLITAKKKTPSPKKATSNTVVSENSLVQQLEDVNSAIYSYVLKLLQKGKFKLTEEEAKIEIEKFKDKVNEAHNNKVSAKSVFEAGSIEKYILANGLKEMKILITVDY